MEAAPLKHYRLIKVDYISEKGKRLVNEDYVLQESLLNDNSLILITDGMGGYEYGDLASRTIALSILEYMRANSSQIPDANRLINEACSSANQEILKIRELKRKKLGATIAGILFLNDSAICFWLGDVRIIHFRNNHLQFQSKDHSLVNELKGQNKDIASESFKRINHIVTKAIQGNPEAIEPDIHEVNNLTIADKFVICSDGVHNVVSPKEMEQIIQKNDNSQSFINLVRSRCEEHSEDNYSIILISL